MLFEGFEKLTSILLINNIHDKLLINNIHHNVMQSSVIRLRHVQSNLFTSDSQYFQNEKHLPEDRNKTMRFNYKQCSNVFPFLALSQ